MKRNLATIFTSLPHPSAICSQSVSTSYLVFLVRTSTYLFLLALGHRHFLLDYCTLSELTQEVV